MLQCLQGWRQSPTAPREVIVQHGLTKAQEDSLRVVLEMSGYQSVVGANLFNTAREVQQEVEDRARAENRKLSVPYRGAGFRLWVKTEAACVRQDRQRPETLPVQVKAILNPNHSGGQ